MMPSLLLIPFLTKARYLTISVTYLIHAEGLICQMICVQVQVNYSICIVDCVQLGQCDKIVFFLTLDILN